MGFLPPCCLTTQQCAGRKKPLQRPDRPIILFEHDERNFGLVESLVKKKGGICARFMCEDCLVRANGGVQDNMWYTYVFGEIPVTRTVLSTSVIFWSGIILINEYTRTSMFFWPLLFSK